MNSKVIERKLKELGIQSVNEALKGIEHTNLEKIIYGQRHHGGTIIPTDRDRALGINPGKIQPADTRSLISIEQWIDPTSKIVNIEMVFKTFGSQTGQVHIERSSYKDAVVLATIEDTEFLCPFKLVKDGIYIGPISQDLWWDEMLPLKTSSDWICLTVEAHTSRFTVFPSVLDIKKLSKTIGQDIFKYINN